MPNTFDARMDAVGRSCISRVGLAPRRPRVRDHECNIGSGSVVNDDELRGVFDRMASGYDSKLARMAPINNGLYFLLESVLAELPQDARILCVGVGTGTELIHLAGVFPGWRFTAVEPSGAMLDICRKRVDEVGLSSRCSFHEGYLESLPLEEMHDAATCFLVSQFILDAQARSDFFRQIAEQTRAGRDPGELGSVG